jgi:hypothetical protein
MSVPSLETLTPILEKYGKWRGDPLSLELEKWGKKVNTSNLELSIVKLFSKILINPLDPSLRLKKPLLDRQWIWEERFLKDYLAKAETPNLSPFDQKPMKVEPHLFAQALLDWAAPEESATETRAVEKVDSKALAPDRDISRKTQIIYTVLAQRFVQRQLWSNLTRSMNESSHALTQSTAGAESHALVLKEQNERGVASYTHALSESAVSLKDTLKACVEVREVIVSDREKDLRQTQKDLEKMKAIRASQLEQIESLRHQRAQRL